MIEQLLKESRKVIKNSVTEVVLAVFDGSGASNITGKDWETETGRAAEARARNRRRQADNKGRAKGGNLLKVKSCIPDNPQRRKQTCGKSPSSPSTPAFQHKTHERAWGEPRGVIRNDKVLRALRYIQDASSRHSEIHVWSCMLYICVSHSCFVIGLRL